MYSFYPKNVMYVFLCILYIQMKKIERREVASCYLSAFSTSLDNAKVGGVTLAIFLTIFYKECYFNQVNLEEIKDS